MALSSLLNELLFELISLEVKVLGTFEYLIVKRVVAHASSLGLFCFLLLTSLLLEDGNF